METRSEQTNGEAPKVCSVVCLTYNHAAYSRIAIETIAKQEYPHIEIVVVDDGSTDGNPEVLDEALKASGRPYKLILQKNTGHPPTNVNIGLAVATGDYVSLLSLDDILYPDCISSKMEILCTDPNLVFVANTCNVEIDGAGEVINSQFRSELFEKEVSSAAEMLELEYKNIGTTYVQGAVFRLDLIREFGGYDEDMTGDDLIFRTKLFRCMIGHPEQRFVLMHRPGMAYRKHRTNISLNVWRQIKTVIEWKNRYFPDRPLPESAVLWIEYFLSVSIMNARFDDIRNGIKFDSAVADVCRAYMPARAKPVAYQLFNESIKRGRFKDIRRAITFDPWMAKYFWKYMLRHKTYFLLAKTIIRRSYRRFAG